MHLRQVGETPGVTLIRAAVPSCSDRRLPARPLGHEVIFCYLRSLRSGYTMRTKCAISDAFVRDCVFAYCASVTQYVYFLSAEHCFRLRNNAIADERVRDCALSTHSVFRPLPNGKNAVLGI